MIDSVVVVVVQLVLAVAVTPVLIGVMRTTRARLEGRFGGGVWQPWRDVRKLMAKEPTRAPGSTPVLTVAPILLMASSLVLCALIPLASTLALESVPGDLFVVVSVLLLGTVALALLGLESGTAFGGMGSSRHMVIAALVEPTVLLSIYALSVPAGTSALAAIVQARRADPASLLNPVSLLAIFALVVVVIAETGRLPVDNPSTHLELTMVHEVMVLDHSGPELGAIHYGMALKLWLFASLLVSLVVPIASGSVWLDGALWLLAVFGVGAAVGVVESVMARLRLLQVARLIMGAGLLSVTALLLS